MRFGFIIPNNWGLNDPDDVINVALRAEQMGFDSVWVNHHVVNAGYILDRLDNKPYYDAITVLTYVAARTTKVRLGTSVLVLPYLNPIVLAKTIATLDVLSGGRVTLGLGVGALRHESDSLGSVFTQRGAYTDEGIEVMKVLWTQEEPSFDGRFFRFSGIKFSPKPSQRPHPPLWIGGLSDAALRRVANMGDGWHPNSLSPEDLAKRLESLRAMLDSAGRSMSNITLSVRQELDLMEPPKAEPRGSTVGTVDHLLRTIEAYSELGVGEMIFSVSGDDIDRINGVMERFVSKVMPRAG